MKKPKSKSPKKDFDEFEMREDDLFRYNLQKKIEGLNKYKSATVRILRKCWRVSIKNQQPKIGDNYVAKEMQLMAKKF